MKNFIKLIIKRSAKLFFFLNLCKRIKSQLNYKLIMAKIKDINLELRNANFVPNEIRALIICETKFDFVTDDDKCMKAAEKQHD